jgi:hypothetical protein
MSQNFQIVLGTDVLGTDVLGTDVLGTDCSGQIVLGKDAAQARFTPLCRPATRKGQGRCPIQA